MTDFKTLCQQTIDIARQAGKIIMDSRGQLTQDDIAIKGLHDFVTRADKASEQHVVKSLLALLPESGFITEEKTIDKKDDRFNWVIDPLDGTTNFIHGAPPVAVSIALMDKDEVVLGVVHEIFLNETFYTWKGGKSYLNGIVIHVSETALVRDSLLATGFPYKNFEDLKPFLNSLAHFFAHSHGIRRLGSAATDLAYVACGRYDGFYEYNLQPWDVAAGTLIIQNAGGLNGDFTGGDNFIFGNQIVSANNNIFVEFRQTVHSLLFPSKTS